MHSNPKINTNIKTKPVISIYSAATTSVHTAATLRLLPEKTPIAD